MHLEMISTEIGDVRKEMEEYKRQETEGEFEYEVNLGGNFSLIEINFVKSFH